MDIRAAEISSILKSQIANFGAEAEVTAPPRLTSAANASRAYTHVYRDRSVALEQNTRFWILGAIILGPFYGQGGVAQNSICGRCRRKNPTAVHELLISRLRFIS